MEKKYYSDERAVQILLSVLKANGIKRVIASPGTTNMTFVGSVQQDSWFEVYSSVDERSAAYMACGMSEESGEPVVLTCTGATASRNYYSGLTEAYYRKLPVLAITSHQGTDRIGHLIAQNIDRSRIPNDIARLSVELPFVSDSRDEFQAIINANKAVQELRRNGGGPVHINLFTRYSRNFNVTELPATRIIKRYTLEDDLPNLPSGKIGIFIGSHHKFSPDETKIIDEFCGQFDSVVFCDHTSGYYGKYKINPFLVLSQKQFRPKLSKVHLLIQIGEISAGISPSCDEVWRVSEDGEIRDTYKKLTSVFQMKESSFFKHYLSSYQDNHSFLDDCNAEYEKVMRAVPELPFGNIWIAKNLSQLLPTPSSIHFGIFNSLRSWNFFKIPEGVESCCNVGGFGIDGSTSSLLGASLVHPEKLYFLIAGDLSFFYDLNALGNRHLGNNLRILLINNGCGAEFKLSSHPCFSFGDEADSYMAAAGHFGNKSNKLVKHFSEDLGFTYITASSKEEFANVYKTFIDPAITSPVLFEIFTDDTDENQALEMICNCISEPLTIVRRKVAKAIKSFTK